MQKLQATIYFANIGINCRQATIHAVDNSCRATIHAVTSVHNCIPADDQSSDIDVLSFHSNPNPKSWSLSNVLELTDREDDEGVAWGGDSVIDRRGTFPPARKRNQPSPFKTPKIAVSRICCKRG